MGGSSFEKIGSYRVLEELGHGTMGTVYRVESPRDEEEVALKVIPRESNSTRIERFRREALAAARIEHPGIVKIQDWGTTSEFYFCAMEYVHGAPLDSVIQATSLDNRLALLPSFMQVVEAMEVAHEADVLHRDLKPSNILVGDDGRTKISDFGLAKLLDIDALTAAGTRLGSPYFMAPEQAMGDIDRMGPMTDVFSLGVILFYILTDRYPFPGKRVADILENIIELAPSFTFGERMRIPVGLRRVVCNCLIKEPADRYPNAGAMADDLRRFQAGRTVALLPAARPSVGRKVAWGMGIVALAAAIALGGRYLWLGHF